MLEGKFPHLFSFLLCIKKLINKGWNKYKRRENAKRKRQGTRLLTAAAFIIFDVIPKQEVGKNGNDVPNSRVPQHRMVQAQDNDACIDDCYYSGCCSIFIKIEFYCCIAEINEDDENGKKLKTICKESQDIHN